MMPARTLLVCLAAAFLLAPPVVAAAPQPMRPLALRDYYGLVGISSAAISPDGSRVAYVRTVTLEQENRTHSMARSAAGD